MPSADSPCGFEPLAQSREFEAALKLREQAPLRSAETLILRRRLWAGVPCAMISRADPALYLGLSARLRDGDLRTLRRHLLILSPDAPCPALAASGALPVMTPATVARLRLDQDRDNLRAGLHQKWRNRLLHAERNRALHVEHRRLVPNRGHWSLAAEDAQQRARGYRSWPSALTLAYASANPGKAQIFEAFEGRTSVAAIIVLRHGRDASYHLAQTTERGKSLSAHNLLLWHALCWLMESGVSGIELGVLDSEDGAGLARFKLGTGAQPHRLGGTWLWWPPLGRGPATALAWLDQRRMR